VISRKKLGALRHIGVLLPDGRVAHCAPVRGEHISSIEEFAAGQGVNIDRIVPATEYARTLKRIADAMRAPKPYDTTTNNCEMFANRMTGQKVESPQLQGVAILAGLAALLALAANST
jgi:phage regulator Rha-like protein